MGANIEISLSLFAPSILAPRKTEVGRLVIAALPSKGPKRLDGVCWAMSLHSLSQAHSSPLTKASLSERVGFVGIEHDRWVSSKLAKSHVSAYEWEPPIDAERLLKESGSAGFLLRTKIRYAIETLDQLYQYGDEGEAKVADLSKETFEEDMSE